MSGNQQALDRERRWATPAGLAALAAVALVVASIIVASQTLGSTSGESEYLRSVDAHQAGRMISAVLQGIGVGLLALPLLFLFRAAEARSDRMRSQLVGVVVAGPVFLAIASLLTGISTIHAADDFVTREVPRLMARGIALGSDRANEAATDTTSEGSLRAIAAGFGIAGQIGLVVGMVYTVLHAMRTGLVSRFWGSLGMALGVVSPIFFQFALLWFVYLGVLLLGRIPGGRPPAWAEGKAVPWPTPGERASAELDEGSGEQPGEDDGSAPAGPDGERRKRKQRG